MLLSTTALPVCHLVMPNKDKASKLINIMSWQDCLACSGCVTSAETVLLEHQSAAEFMSKLADPGVTVVVSVSPQSRTALAAFYGLSPAETLQKLTGFFKGLGVRAVLDTSTGRDFALLEAAAEFVQRYREAHPELAGESMSVSLFAVWAA